VPIVWEKSDESWATVSDAASETGSGSAPVGLVDTGMMMKANIVTTDIDSAHCVHERRTRRVRSGHLGRSDAVDESLLVIA
jgi:hypothetical protein